MDTLSVAQSINFPGNVCARSCVVSLSEYNTVAFATEEGLYILVPSVCRFSLDSTFPVGIRKTFIPAPSQPNVFEFGVAKGMNVQTSRKREELFEFILDRTLSPAASCNQSYKGYRQTSWSPSGIGPNETCILAALTMDHRLTILVNNYQRKWISTVELSDLYYKHLKEKLDFKMSWMTEEVLSSESSKPLQDLKAMSYATAATYIAFSHKMCSGVSEIGDNLTTFAFLAVGMKNGSVVLWKIPPIAFATLKKASELISVALIFDGGVDMVTSLCWVKLNHSLSAMLVVGGATGRVKSFNICVCHDGIVTITESFFLWCDEDKLRVNQICCDRFLNDRVNIVAGKSNFIVAWKVNTNSVICKTYTRGNYLQPLVGLFYNELCDEFCAASADGIVMKVTLKNVDAGLTVNMERILKDNENEHMNYFGLIASSNRFLYCLVEGIVTWYDHLALREPLKVMYISSKDMKKQLEALLERINDSDSRLFMIADVVQSVNYYWSLNREFPSCLASLLHLPQKDLRTLSTCKLQLIRWLLQLLLFTDQDDAKIGNYKCQVEGLDKLLIGRQLVLLLKRFSRSDKGAVGEVLQSRIATSCLWLGRLQLGEEEEEEEEDRKLLATIVSNEIPQSKNFQESCRLCQKPVSMDNLYHGRCESGHLFGRCSLSLALCDQPVYSNCLNCNVLANVDVVGFLGEARCPFCGCLF